MTRSAAIAPLRSEYDGFLFAQIGEDKSGIQFSVLSALARLDVDPWQEAAELTELSWEAATQRLTALIASLPGRPSTDLDPGPDAESNAARLIALLPGRAHPKISSSETLLGVGSQAVIYGGFLVFMLVVLYMLAIR